MGFWETSGCTTFPRRLSAREQRVCLVFALTGYSINYSTSTPFPARRSDATLVLHEDMIVLSQSYPPPPCILTSFRQILYGGRGSLTDCVDSLCGDAWTLNVNKSPLLFHNLPLLPSLSLFVHSSVCPNCVASSHSAIINCLQVSGAGSCPPACSAHGICEWGYCVCDVGFLGVTCEQQQCPNSR
eukprot:768081-Hanusia_phi.AAC.4